MFDLEKFKTGKYFVHLPTSEVYKEAMEFLKKNELSYINKTWHDNQTCIRYEKHYGITKYANYDFYINKGYELLELNEKGDKVVINQKINLEGNNELLADNASHYTKLMLDNKSIYLDKNEKYGDAFAETIQKYGYISALTRMNDKFNRIEEFTLKGFQDEEESLRDSLMDLANYCYMYVMELDKEKEDSIE